MVGDYEPYQKYQFLGSGTMSRSAAVVTLNCC